VLNARRSVRSFAAKGLQLAELGQLLWAGGGDSADSISGATRTAPSAGGLYPVELYVAVGEVRNLSSGIYRYVPGGHSVAKLIDGDRRRELASAALGQRWMAGAPAVVVITGDPGRVRGKYGERGVRRYMEIDAGMAAENLLLQAAALGLGGTPVGAFRDGSVSGLLGLQNREPLLIIPVGVPAE
jgi:SagB-type dehydrogenase family enzyme